MRELDVLRRESVFHLLAWEWARGRGDTEARMCGNPWKDRRTLCCGYAYDTPVFTVS